MGPPNVSGCKSEFKNKYLVVFLKGHCSFKIVYSAEEFIQDYTRSYSDSVRVRVCRVCVRACVRVDAWECAGAEFCMDPYNNRILYLGHVLSLAINSTERACAPFASPTQQTDLNQRSNNLPQ